ncbi:MAG: phospholipase D-like domain-containing protein [Pseudanabaenaceae cyanobacterium bins.39]|nr:phospholipase D-like domain-containing protein [Pseudanabaenaceae cyanobacterium bins.39]
MSAGCQYFQASSNSDQLAALPQHSRIQVFFNYNQAEKYRDPYRQIERFGDNLENIIIENIDNAKVSIDMAVQELRLPNIAKAMIKAKERGVRVRLILENKYSQSFAELTKEQVNKFNQRDRDRYTEFLRFADLNNDGVISNDELNQRDAIQMIKTANIPWLDDTADGSKGSGLMHHKFVVVDQKVVLLGSPNFTMSDIHGDFTKPETRGNANNLLRIDSKEVAEKFTEEFAIMWGDGPEGKLDSRFGLDKPTRKIAYMVIEGAQIRIKFSPDSEKVANEQTSNGLIGTALAGGEQTIDLALFVFSDQGIVNILRERMLKNVQIRALIDPQFAYRNYSATLNMWGLRSAQDCREGKDNAWKKPLQTVGVPSMNRGDLLHHKFAILDRNLIITGSHNWTNAANHLNDEALVLIQNKTVAAHFQREYDRLYQDATLGPTAKLSQNAVCDNEKTDETSAPNDP